MPKVEKVWLTVLKVKIKWKSVPKAEKIWESVSKLSKWGQKLKICDKRLKILISMTESEKVLESVKKG